MNIPAHRAAAVAPTPAHSFELRNGDQLVNLTEEERKAAEAAGLPVSPTAKSRRGADAPAAPAPAAE